MKKNLLTAWIVLFVFVGGLHAQTKDSLTFVNAKWNIKQLADGVEWRQHHFKDKEQLFGANQYINFIVVDQQKSKNKFSVFASKDGELVRTSRAATDAGALAAINGSFFNTRSPYKAACYTKIDGEVLSYIGDKPGAFSNHIIIDKQGRVSLEQVDVSERTEPTILSCYAPILILNGKKRGNPKDDRDPRTGIATGGGKTILITIDGRNSQSRGITSQELATILQWLGMDNAIELDGGGSTTMYVQGEPDNGVVNHPSDSFFGFNHKGERSVKNGIMLI